MIQFELLNVFNLGHSLWILLFSLSHTHKHTYYHREHTCHICIQSPQPTLHAHVQHCVSSRQARTAVLGAGISKLKLLWTDAVLYKVSMGFKSGVFVLAVLHSLTFNLSLYLRAFCYFMQ